MTDTVRNLLSSYIDGKASDAQVFTRPNGSPVRDFRATWERALQPYWSRTDDLWRMLKSDELRYELPKCKSQRSLYTRLIFHDLRRTAARNLRRAGISETVIMKIGGWRTRSVFERYAIVSRTDIADAMRKLQQSEQATHTQISHEMVTRPLPTTQTLQ